MLPGKAIELLLDKAENQTVKESFGKLLMRCEGVVLYRSSPA
jgi:hypothetical protein